MPKAARLDIRGIPTTVEGLMATCGVTKEGPSKYVVPNRIQVGQNIYSTPPFVDAVAKLVKTNPDVISVPAAIAFTVNASNTVGGRAGGHGIDLGSTRHLLPKDLRDTSSLKYLAGQAENAVEQACLTYHLPATELPGYQALVYSYTTPLGQVKPEKGRGTSVLSFPGYARNQRTAKYAALETEAPHLASSTGEGTVFELPDIQGKSQPNKLYRITVSSDALK